MSAYWGEHDLIKRLSKKEEASVSAKEAEVVDEPPKKKARIENSCSDRGGPGVFSINNDVYFHTGVDRNSISELIKELNAVAARLDIAKLQMMKLSLENNNMDISKIEPQIIKLHINSGGGSVFDGFMATNLIKTFRYDIHTIIEGRAASAATMLSIVGKKRIISSTGFILIHQMSGMVWGKLDAIEEVVVNFKTLTTKANALYKKYTTLSDEQLEEFCKHDLYWTAEEALERGMVDEIIDL